FDGHDYLAYVNPYDNGIDIQEMIWGTPPSFFSLAAPVTTAVAPVEPPVVLRLAVLGRGAGERDVVFRLSLPAASGARLELFDVTGRRVRCVRDGTLPRGESLVTWDGRNEFGAV